MSRFQMSGSFELVFEYRDDDDNDENDDDDDDGLWWMMMMMDADG